MDDDELFTFVGAQPVQFGSSLGATKEQEEAIKEVLEEGSRFEEDSPSPEIKRARKRTISDRDMKKPTRWKGKADGYDLEWWLVKSLSEVQGLSFFVSFCSDSESSSSSSNSPSPPGASSPDLPASPSDLSYTPTSNLLDYESLRLLQ